MTEQEAKARLRERIRRLFNTDPVVKQDAQEALRTAWGYDDPSFRVEELAAHPSENCAIMAARRDGQKEVLAWLMKF
jgi:hypothetical protein